MSNEVKHSLIWACVAATVVISIPWSISYYYTTVTKAAIEAGLVQSTLHGSSGTYWVKPGDR